MEHIWSNRFARFLNERVFILRRVANGFSFLPLLLFLFGLYYYPILLEHWPDHFPTEIMLSIVIAWALTRGNFRSFLQPPDIVYLLPAEHRLRGFIRKSMMYNIAVQCFGLFALLIVLSPLLNAKVLDKPYSFFILMMIVLILKVANIFCLWETLKSDYGSFQIIRWLLQFGLLYSLFNKLTFGIVLSVMSIFAFGLLVMRIASNRQLPWERLIEMDGKLDMWFYQWMGNFVDHAKVTGKIVKRKLLIRLTESLRKKRERPLYYLYTTLILRSEVIGIIHRLVILGSIVILFVDQYSWIIAMYTLFILMISTQVTMYWQTVQYAYWPNLYPFHKEERQDAFLSVANQFIYVYVGILLLVVIVKSLDLRTILFALFIGSSLPYLYIRLYAKKKIANR